MCTVCSPTEIYVVLTGICYNRGIESILMQVIGILGQFNVSLAKVFNPEQIEQAERMTAMSPMGERGFLFHSLILAYSVTSGDQLPAPKREMENGPLPENRSIWKLFQLAAQM